MKRHPDVRFMSGKNAESIVYVEKWIKKYRFNLELKDQKNKEEVYASLMLKRREKVRKKKDVKKVEEELKMMRLWLEQSRKRCEDICKKKEKQVLRMKIGKDEETGPRRRTTPQAA